MDKKRVYISGCVEGCWGAEGKYGVLLSGGEKEVDHGLTLVDSKICNTCVVRLDNGQVWSVNVNAITFVEGMVSNMNLTEEEIKLVQEHRKKKNRMKITISHQNSSYTNYTDNINFVFDGENDIEIDTEYKNKDSVSSGGFFRMNLTLYEAKKLKGFLEHFISVKEQQN